MACRRYVTLVPQYSRLYRPSYDEWQVLHEQHRRVTSLRRLAFLWHCVQSLRRVPLSAKRYIGSRPVRTCLSGFCTRTPVTLPSIAVSSPVTFSAILMRTAAGVPLTISQNGMPFPSPVIIKNCKRTAYSPIPRKSLQASLGAVRHADRCLLSCLRRRRECWQVWR